MPVAGRSSTLLIGKNGAGKTTVGRALEVLQKIARGTNRVGELVKPQDATRGRTDTPIRFEIEVELGKKIYGYGIALELPFGFKELRILEEKVTVDGKPVYTRDVAKVHLARAGFDKEADFFVDWHLVALPIIQQPEIEVLKSWLARMLILRPVPSLISGDSDKETLEPNAQVSDYAAWFSGLLAQTPAAYSKIDEYLKQVIPDLKDIKNPAVGKDSKSLVVQFANELGSMSLSFSDLSDGEKCFMICALVIAANHAYGPMFCFWDEPDNYLAISEVGHFVMTLRKAFATGGQFIATSHNSEAIRRFSDENTLVLYRRSHLEPVVVRLLGDLQVAGDLVSALVRDDIEP